MDDHDNIIEQREALLDGVNFICSKLERVHDKKRSNFFLKAQVLITLALPQNKKDLLRCFIQRFKGIVQLQRRCNQGWNGDLRG